MRLWCDRCHEAVEPEVHREYEIPDANVGGYEVEEIYTCPICGSEVYQDPGECVICGENIKPDESLCDSCREEIDAFVELMASAKGVGKDKVLDGFAEYLD